MIFDERERNFLNNLKGNDIWLSIIKKIQIREPLPGYKPSKDSGKEFHKWIYRSGGDDAIQGLISQLMDEPVKLKKEENYE